MKACILNIQRYAIHDGPGVRQTIFFKGCPLRCWWCHNPESQKKEIETRIAEKDFEGTKIQEKKIMGKQMTIAEVMTEIEKDRLLYEESGGGVTFSGGEPLMQIDFLESILKECKHRDLHTVVDTCGQAPFSSFERILPYTDIFYFDLKHLDSEKHKEVTGVKNQVILDNLKKLDSMGANIQIRFPMIPTINNSDEHLHEMIEFIKDLNNRKLSILPFHKLGKEKFRLMNQEYKMENVKEPSKEEVNRVRELFTQKEIEVTLNH